jgi:serine phosphatase RsbU (regulator of sigma subunit)/PAS domain-containing protein
MPPQRGLPFSLITLCVTQNACRFTLMYSKAAYHAVRSIADVHWGRRVSEVPNDLPSPAIEDLLSSNDHPRADVRRELLELAITAAGVGTFDWDLVDGTLEWDDRLIELFEYEKATFDRSIEAFEVRLHPDDIERVRAELQSAVDGCGEFESEYRIVLPGGAIRWIGARGRALCDEKQQAVRMLGAAWDNSARAEGEARVARVMESMTTPFFSLDPSWRFTYVNAEAEVVLGRSRDELLGGVLWKLFPATVGSEFETQYRKAMTEGEHVAFDAYYPAPLDAWYEVRAWRNTDGLAVYFLEVTSRHHAQKAAVRAAERTALLGRITEQLARTSDPVEAATRLAGLVVPALCEWSVVTLIDDSAAVGAHRGLGTAVAKHVDPELQEVVDEYASARLGELKDDAIVVQAMQSGEIHLILSGAHETVGAMFGESPVQQLWSRLDADSVAVLPLSGRTGPVGMFTLCNTKERGAFSEEDIVSATHVAARAGLVMENARLYRQQLDLAEALQRSLLTDPPEPDHVQIVVRYLPAAETAQVGGDWYDAFVQPDGATVLVIGDVVGHNSASAAAMSQVRTLLRGIGVLDNDGPAEILRKVDLVLERLQVDADATAIVARLEQNESEQYRGLTRLRWSSAGHPPPMVIHADGVVLPLASAVSDLFLGVMPDAERNEYEVTLDRDATVVLYTDGLVERRGQPLEDGLRKLHHTLADLGNCDLDTLCDETLRRMRPSDSEDDVAIIAVKLHPQNRPRPPEAGPNRLPPNIEPSPEVVPQAD